MTLFNRLLLLGLVITFPLFFIGGPDYYSPRSFKEVWNLGHILFFAAAAYLSLKNIKPLAEKSVLVQLLVVFSVSLFLGVLIEVFQYDSSRDSSVLDVYRDMLGAALGVVWFFSVVETIPRKPLLVIRTALFLLFVLQVLPVFVMLYDEWKAKSNFPVLANFESSAELGRWQGNADFYRTDEEVYKGQSLKVVLGTQQYSGVALKYFPGDWSGYSQLMFEVHNPQQEPLPITVRIHDEAHRYSEQLYSDRYNQRFLLQYGWNHMVIDLADVASAPEGREMDLSAVAGFGFFVIAEKKRHVLFLDDVRLEK